MLVAEGITAIEVTLTSAGALDAIAALSRDLPGHVTVGAGTVLDADALENLVLLDAAKGEDGKIYAAPMSVSVKSLVWYPRQEFEKAGYQIPKTQAELTQLTDRIRSEGKTPWCIGIESGTATGWPATDAFAASGCNCTGTRTRSTASRRGPTSPRTSKSSPRARSSSTT